MANQASGAEDPVAAKPLPGVRDAQMLKEAMHEAISESPEAFLMTTDDLKAKEPDYWEMEVRSSTWAVIQEADKVVGFAVARSPDGEKDRDVDPAAARFIESVWIHPDLRRQRLAERLVRFLFEVEHAQSPSVRRFLLWVFDKNKYAIRLYKRMGFRHVGRQKLDDQSGREELRYEYRLEPDAGRVQAALAARQDDQRKYGLVYRVLGEDTR
jgi:ribosomal protein S18 acetylase RimI-like enzyme